MSASLAWLRGVFSRVVRALALTLVFSLASGTAHAIPGGAVAGAAVPAALLGAAAPNTNGGPGTSGAAAGGTAASGTAASGAAAGGSAAGSTVNPEAQAGAPRTAPADSPTASSSIVLPATPAGYESTRHGWLQLDVAPSQRHWVAPLIKEADAFRAEVNARLGFVGLERVVVRLAENARRMVDLAPAGAPYPEYAEGVAYSRLGLILLTAEPEHPSEENDLLTTFRHELAHVALHDALQSHHVPLWFNEGLAIHLSRENAFGRSKALWTASVSGNLLPLNQIERSFPNDIVGVPLAYAESADIVRFLLRTQDQERFRLLIKRVARGQAFEAALRDSYGMDLYNLESLWLEDVKSRNTLWPVLFSGTVLWTFGVALIVLAWRRKRERQRTILARWEREEALEAERARAAVLARVELDRAELARAELDRAELERTRSTPPWSDSPPPLPTNVGTLPPHNPARAQRDSQVPRVQHDGNWHTLH